MSAQAPESRQHPPSRIEPGNPFVQRPSTRATIRLQQVVPQQRVVVRVVPQPTVQPPQPPPPPLPRPSPVPSVRFPSPTGPPLPSAPVRGPIRHLNIPYSTQDNADLHALLDDARAECGTPSNDPMHHVPAPS